MDKTQRMKMPNLDKTCKLPAGGPRVGNVIRKPGLPTKPSGANFSFGSKKK